MMIGEIVQAGDGSKFIALGPQDLNLSRQYELPYVIVYKRSQAQYGRTERASKRGLPVFDEPVHQLRKQLLRVGRAVVEAVAGHHRFSPGFDHRAVPSAISAIALCSPKSTPGCFITHSRSIIVRAERAG